MTQSIIYALISMLFAGANDALLKKQAISGYSQSQFMGVAGIVWSSVFIILALFFEPNLPSWLTIRWTLTIGILSAMANRMLIYSMTKLEAGVASTIYRLNLAFAAIIAFVFLAEPINIHKLSGLILASLSVICFAHSKQKMTAFGGWLMLLIILSACLLRAIYGISYKIALNDGAQYLWFLSGPGLGWTFLGTTAALRTGNFRISSNIILRGVLSGFLLCGLVFFFAKAIELGQASIIIPVSQLSFIVTAILAWMFFGEKFSLKKIIGLSLACLSIFVFSQSS